MTTERDASRRSSFSKTLLHFWFFFGLAKRAGGRRLCCCGIGIKNVNDECTNPIPLRDPIRLSSFSLSFSWVRPCVLMPVPLAEAGCSGIVMVASPVHFGRSWRTGAGGRGFRRIYHTSVCFQPNSFLVAMNDYRNTERSRVWCSFLFGLICMRQTTWRK